MKRACIMVNTNTDEQNMSSIPPFKINGVLIKQLILFVGILIGSYAASAQNLSQVIRGTVFDKDSRLPLPGANVLLVNSNPQLGAISDENGNFRINNVPIGRQSIQVSFVGYKSSTIQNLIVNSAKEIVLEIELEENVTEVKEVTVVANKRKDQPINKMASVSARTFTIEETEKYAGSRGDIARMAMNYAGVAAANDQRNDIIIRGNSPSGLLWRMEDIDIPNPNHFAENGTTGGPVGMLNNNLLVNSDFFTGAFPAEYGNALSGVFDLKMRNGNNEKHEFLFQSGFNGFELGAEGPLSKNHKSSYLANFRYSTLELMDNIIDIGTSGVPKYKDFSYKLNFPTKKGRLSVFGLAGNSEIAMLDSKKNEQDLYTDEGQDLYNFSNMGTSGISYSHFLSTKTYVKFMFSGLFQEGGAKIDTLDADNIPHRQINHAYKEYRITGGMLISSKLNSHLTVKSGFNMDRMGFDLETNRFNAYDQDFRKLIDYSRSLGNGNWLLRAYSQATFKLNDRFTLNPGIHMLYFDLNQSKSVEPRFGISYALSDQQKLSFGYGYHSKLQSLSTYFLGSRMTDGSLILTNKNLDFTRSNQFIMAYDASLTANTRIKLEGYYQYLFHVPVERSASSFSMLNTGAGWGIDARDSLENKGTGKNYGIELTLERFFSRNLYYLVTLSVFDSKYKGSDQTERNTAFNGNYVVNVLIGKEIRINGKSTFNIDYKLSCAGGKRYTPIDIEKSKNSRDVEYLTAEAFSKQFSPFFKTDIKFGYRLNGKHVSQEWQFYVENFTNHKNILMQNYSKSKNEITNIYQLGVFPMILYRIHF